ncbi:DUF2238 domain-containing protein [Candidatus Woesearchaeota archaeon]|jgi:uncharacterized membrane protein YjdF|nr:DUF2238 domain-containing protein [Candidatus Woesearchaeota archaeon]MBT3537215.1 DUF2238 domain-containing protein [Candidatus Woesearchaeota archaeon]MBT4698202.1 DUF2238 domain-containing protein [Candidatus Woesearchaeota archaeon]MBT4717753.1 DUF2238 domain-containing protein [Candidatus Woesearchaeota archaeon]MBT7106475.1 DUF2238 domain-containing protein [Candidatus Woesearchaeota archaeon]
MKTKIGLDVRKPVIESIFVVSCLILGLFAFYAHYVNGGSWFWDNILSIFIIILLFLFRKKLRLNPLTTSLVCLALIFHSAGTFGFYSISPVSVEYDVFTHFFGLFAVSFLLCELVRGRGATKGMMVVLVILASMGVGSFVELLEYSGYEMFGTGEGVFMIGDGDFGDVVGDAFGEGYLAGVWIDTMHDSVVNLLGALVGIVCFLLYGYYRRE